MLSLGLLGGRKAEIKIGVSSCRLFITLVLGRGFSRWKLFRRHRFGGQMIAQMNLFRGQMIDHRKRFDDQMIDHRKQFGGEMIALMTGILFR